jgi:hypothetical protein
MNGRLIAAAFFAWAVISPATAQTTCSEAYLGCQKAQDGTRCDVVCKAYCSKEKKACMKSGNFSTKTNKWIGLQKK